MVKKFFQFTAYYFMLAFPLINLTTASDFLEDDIVEALSYRGHPPSLEVTGGSYLRQWDIGETRYSQWVNNPTQSRMSSDAWRDNLWTPFRNISWAIPITFTVLDFVASKGISGKSAFDSVGAGGAANMALSCAIFDTVRTTCEAIGIRARRERNPASFRGALARTIMDLSTCAISWAAYEVITRNLIEATCDDDLGVLECTILKPSAIPAAQGLLITAGMLNIFVVFRVFYSIFRENSVRIS